MWTGGNEVSQHHNGPVFFFSSTISALLRLQLSRQSTLEEGESTLTTEVTILKPQAICDDLFPADTVGTQAAFVASDTGEEDRQRMSVGKDGTDASLWKKIQSQQMKPVYHSKGVARN